MAMLGVVFERHGGFPDSEWDYLATTVPRQPVAATGPCNTVPRTASMMALIPGMRCYLVILPIVVINSSTLCRWSVTSPEANASATQ